MSLVDLVSEWSDLVVSGTAIADVRLDSRAVQQCDVFVALAGSSDDGARYVKQAVANGAIAVLHDANQLVDVSGCDCIAIDNIQEKLALIAAKRYPLDRSAMSVFAVTGTNGKTSCCDYYAALRNAMGGSCGTIGTLGIQLNDEESESGLTTPDIFTVYKALHSFQLDGAKYAAMEVSSHALAQGRVQNVPFKSAAFTNLSRDHLDYHGSLEEYGRQKAKLFSVDGLQCVVINVDDEFGRSIKAAHAAKPTCRELITYSVESSDADVYADKIILSKNGIAAHINTPWGSDELRVNQIGRFNLQNVLAVVAALCAEGCELSAVLSAVAELNGVPGRMQIVSNQDEPIVIVDYAHTPDALENAIKAAREHCGANIIVVFGCGGDRDKGKRPMMGEIAQRLADKVIVTSDNPRTEQPSEIITDVLSGTKAGSIIVEADRKVAIELAIAQAGNDDCVLIAGKGHETYQLLNSGRIDFDDVGISRAALNSLPLQVIKSAESAVSKGAVL